MIFFFLKSYFLMWLWIVKRLVSDIEICLLNLLRLLHIFIFIFLNMIFCVCIGRIWAGHNIVEFDCARVREAFAEIGKPAPEPKDTIDSLILLRQKFGKRAGDMKVSLSLFLTKKQHLINISISSHS